MRNRRLIVIPGLVNTGKTTQIMKMIDNYKHGKILIFDKQNDAIYDVFAKIPIEAIKHQRSGIYKIFQTDWKEVIIEMNDHFRKGLIILEDAGSYLPQYEFKPLYSMFVGRRHREHHCDLIITFHSINRIPPYVLESLDILILFKTNENLSSSIKDSVPRPDAVKFYFDKVEAHPDPHYFEILNLTGLNVKKS